MRVFCQHLSFKDAFAPCVFSLVFLLSNCFCIFPTGPKIFWWHFGTTRAFKWLSTIHGNTTNLCEDVYSKFYYYLAAIRVEPSIYPPRKIETFLCIAWLSFSKLLQKSGHSFLIRRMHYVKKRSKKAMQWLNVPQAYLYLALAFIILRGMQTSGFFNSAKRFDSKYLCPLFVHSCCICTGSVLSGIMLLLLIAKKR